MIPTWQMEAYERLRTEIVKSAVQDYKIALRKSDRIGYICDEQIQLERWFRSKWGQLLSGDNGKFIIEKCRQTYKTSVSKKGKQHIPDDVQKRICREYRREGKYKTILKRYNITSATLYNILGRWEK